MIDTDGSGAMGELLRRGRSVLEAGDYVSAVADFENAVRVSSGTEKAVEAAFTALQQIAVSQFVIDKFLDAFGWSIDDYRGFDHLEPQLSRKAVRQHLEVIAGDVPSASPLGLKMRMTLKKNRFCETRGLTTGGDGDGDTEPQLADQVLFFRGLAAMRRGDHDSAISQLSSAIAENPMCGAPCLVLGRIYRGRGDGALALAHLNLALSHPEDRWLSGAFASTGIVPLGKYKTYQIVVYRSEFYAVPDSGDLFFSVVNGVLTLCQYSVASAMRAKLLRGLPPSGVAWLRRLVHSTPLRREFIRPVDLLKFFHAKNFGALIVAVEEHLANVDGRPKSAPLRP